MTKTKKILFIDTETSGLPDFNKRARDPAQPHIVQFAAIQMDDAGNKLFQCDLIAKPDGWEIPADVAAIHGITNEIATVKGIPEHEIAALAFCRIQESSLVVGHNISFDKFICRIAMRRFDLMQDSDDERWKQMPTVCTMKMLTNICKLPGRFAGSYKWPKLSEAYQHAFGETLDNAHNALVDIQATARLYFWMIRQGIVTENGTVSPR